MKQLKLMKTLLVAVGLLLGTSAWATNLSTFAGTANNGIGWNAADDSWVSKTYTLSGNGTFTFSFYTTNATDEGWRGWNLFVGNSNYATNLWDTWMICRGFGSVVNAYGTAAGSQTPTYSDTYTAVGNSGSIYTAMNGATVNLVVSRNSTAINAVATVTPTNGDKEFTQTFTYTYGGEDNVDSNLYLTFAVDCGYISINNATFKAADATESTTTLSCASSITMVSGPNYNAGDGNGANYESKILLNSWANGSNATGGAGAMSFVLDNKWDAYKVKRAALRIYPISKCNRNRSGDIYIHQLDAYPSIENNGSHTYNTNHKVYSYGDLSTKCYTFSSEKIATIASSGYNGSTPATGAYYDIDITDYIRTLTSKNAGNSVFFGFDVSDWAADIIIGAYYNDYAPELVITYSDTEIYDYTVKAYFGETELETISSGAVENGTTITYAISKYIIKDNVLYQANTLGSNYYISSVEISSSNQVVSVTYTKPAISGTPVYFADFGETPSTTPSSTEYQRCSGAQTSTKNGTFTLIPASTLEDGTYKIEIGHYKNRKPVFYVGDSNIGTCNSFTNGGTYGTTTFNNVKVVDGVAITVRPGTGASYVDNMDYVLAIKTSDDTNITATIGANGYTTFASPYALNVEGKGAYYIAASDVDESKVTLTEAPNTVAAGTGLILKGTAADVVSIPVVASADAISGNMLVGCTTATEITSKTTNYANFYVMNAEAAQFLNLKNYLDANAENKVTIPAGKAYLDTTDANVVGGRELVISFDDELTGINGVESVKQQVEGYYNLAGQRIAQPTKGLYIVNGKKVVIK